MTLPEIHVPLGLTEAAYRAKMHEDGSVLVSFDPNYHSHPILGIVGHMHGRGRQPHGHVPEVTWGKAIFYDEAGNMSDRRPDPECIARDPNTKRNCPYSLYCAVCDMDDDLGPIEATEGGSES